MTTGLRRTTLFIVAVIAAAALAACGSASRDGGEAQASQSTPDDSAVPAAQVNVDEASEPASEGAKTVSSEPQSAPSGGSSTDFAQNVQVGPDVEFDGIASWINSEPLTLEGLRGNVVLVDFWTYTCINCQRTLPYVKSWHDKYADQGLVVIGMHSPEFSFEKGRAGVIFASDKFGLEYPIAQDNDFVTWRAFKNAYWPSKYLIDRKGVVRYNHIGEGAYEQTERMIQQLLAEPGT